MKEEIMQRINIILNALNSVSVNGKANLANLSGSIATLEEIAALLSHANITEKNDADAETNPNERRR